jgi:ubiquinone/menaquinone biosynthesis C-methylase UbiE
MTIILPKRPKRDVAAAYREFANSGKLAMLNGRYDLDERTDAMMDFIRRHVDFKAGHRVLDIGCGDARLLRSLPQMAFRAGTVLTEEERAVLTVEDWGIHFIAGSFADLPRVVPGPFDRIVANGCLPIIASTSAAEKTIGAMVELLNPGGKIWLGELFSKANPDEIHKIRFNSKWSALANARRRHGLVFAAKFARHIVKHWRRASEIVERRREFGPWWFIQPSEIPSLAQRFGLIVDGIWDCEKETGEPFYADHGRFSVLLRKPENSQ